MSEGEKIIIERTRTWGFFVSRTGFRLYNDSYYLPTPIGVVRDIEREHKIDLRKISISLEYCKETVGKRTLYKCGKCGSMIWNGEMFTHLEGEGAITPVTRDDGVNETALIYRLQLPKQEAVK